MKVNLDRKVLSIIYVLILFSIGLNNMLIGYKIIGISIDRLFQIISFLILFPVLINYFKDKNIRVIRNFIFYLVLLSIFKNSLLLIYGNDLSAIDVARSIFRTIQYFIVFLLAYHTISNVKNWQDYVLFFMLFAFLLAFFQNPFTPFTDYANKIRVDYFSVNMTKENQLIFENFLKDEARNFFRVSGPYGQPVTLTYALVFASIITFYAYVFYQRTKILYSLYLSFFLIVSTFTLTRSAVLSISLLVYFAFVYFAKTKRRKIVMNLLIVLTGLIALSFLLSLSDEFARLISSDESSSGKIWLFIKGVLTLVENPISAVFNGDQKIDQFVYLLSSHDHVLRFTPHNGLLSLGYEYTVFVYPALLSLIYYYYRSAKKIFSKKQKVFWTVVWFAYFIQQSFHNNGLFFTDFTSVVVLALFIYEMNKTRKLAMDRKI